MATVTPIESKSSRYSALARDSGDARRAVSSHRMRLTISVGLGRTDLAPPSAAKLLIEGSPNWARETKSGCCPSTPNSPPKKHRNCSIFPPYSSFARWRKIRHKVARTSRVRLDDVLAYKRELEPTAWTH